MVLIILIILTGTYLVTTITLSGHEPFLIQEASSSHSALALGLSGLFFIQFVRHYFSIDLASKESRASLGLPFLLFILAALACFHGITWDFSEQTNFLLNANRPIEMLGTPLVSQVGVTTYQKEILGSSQITPAAIMIHVNLTIAILVVFFRKSFFGKTK